MYIEWCIYKEIRKENGVTMKKDTHFYYKAYQAYLRVFGGVKIVKEGMECLFWRGFPKEKREKLKAREIPKRERGEFFFLDSCMNFQEEGGRLFIEGWDATSHLAAYCLDAHTISLFAFFLFSTIF